MLPTVVWTNGQKAMTLLLDIVADLILSVYLRSLEQRPSMTLAIYPVHYLLLAARSFERARPSTRRSRSNECDINIQMKHDLKYCLLFFRQDRALASTSLANICRHLDCLFSTSPSLVSLVSSSFSTPLQQHSTQPNTIFTTPLRSASIDSTRVCRVLPSHHKTCLISC
jgi:hypothetical protein